MKSFFKSLKNEVKNEVTRQIDKTLSKGRSQEDGGEGSIQKVDMSMVEGVLGLLGGGGGSASGSGGGLDLNSIINAIQGQAGGFLPGSVGKYLPGILKVAEIIGHGMGDDTPRNEQNADGSFIDNFVKTIVGGRKIHGGKSSSKVKPLDRLLNHTFRPAPPRRGGKVGDRSGGSFYNRGADVIQDYEKIRSKCLENGELFEDPEFPAEDPSVFFSRSERRSFQWLRPHEIHSDPVFFHEGATRFDVKQGELGDCWLLAALANLTLNPKLLHQVVPEDNSFEDNYAGIFHFRFWQYGRWVDVVVDDRLPTSNGKLMFMHSADKNEFWSALLEKAYAKLHGSYEALKGGTTCEALEDFTGGVTEMYDLKNSPALKDKLYKMILKAFERSSFLGCSIEPDPNVVEAKGPLGLIRGHAYSITDVKLVDIETPRVRGKIPLLRIRNPWGNEAEWTGPWSDGSKEWEFIDDDTKEEIGLTFDADGEFWMSFKDFMLYFDRLEICNLSPDSLEEEELDSEGKMKWNMSVFEGAWIRGATAGGCRNYINTFANNPQYVIDVEDPDDDGKCTIIVALMQKNRRAQRKLGMDCLTIGFAIYQIDDATQYPSPLPVKFFKYNASVARSPTFINLREVCSRFTLNPGTYVIVPSTFEPNEEGDFIIRVFTEGHATMKENDGDVGVGEIDDRVKETEPEENEAAKKVQEFFKTVAGDDMEIDWSELKEVLDLALKREFAFEGFSKDVCRSMVAMMDIDRSGKLGLDEFVSLWKSIRTWKSVFQIYDQDNSGHLSSFELRQALQSAGYSVNNKVLESLALRYGDHEGKIYFDDFIMCAVKLRCMIEIFKEKDTENENSANFTLEEWVEKTLYS